MNAIKDLILNSKKIFVNYMSYHIPKHIKIYKESQKQNMINTDIKIPSGEIANTKVIDVILSDEIASFYSNLKTCLPHVDSRFFEENIKKLQLKESLFIVYNLIFKVHYGGLYRPDKNIIKVNYNYESLSHELLHMASSFYDEVSKITFVGFRQRNNNNINIGRGLNEGYTELLNERYFLKEKSKSAYFYEINIAFCLEKVIGQKKMEQMFFKADLYGLTEELLNYSNKENIIAFLKNIDLINRVDGQTKSNRASDYLIDLLYKVYKFLMDIYIKKLTLNQLPYTEYKKGIEAFIQMFFIPYKVKNLLIEYAVDIILCYRHNTK